MGGGGRRGGEGKCSKLLRREKKIAKGGGGGGARLIYTQLTVCSTGPPPILWKLRSIAHAPSSSSAGSQGPPINVTFGGSGGMKK